MSNYKRIAKNTLYLYIRMFIIMGVTLFTSRVVLDKLGVTDYSLYNVVGGVVSMLSFLNGTLTIGTSRFITYELGTGNIKKLKDTFITSFYTHLSLATIIVVLMETGGLWFIYNKLVIPYDRLDACFWVFQFSILTTFINIIQVPYSSLVSSHERFNLYAFVGIFEVFAKLGVCYAISATHGDRLILYAFLLNVIQVVIAGIYFIYSKINFAECTLSFFFDKKIFRDLLSFSGWNVVANLASTLNLQGVVLIMNIFLSPVVVAAQSLANQVSNALMGFINNFRMAINPQIIKLFAVGDRESSKKLTLETTVICFDLILILALPCIYTMKFLMSIWLVETPEYAVLFTQSILICNIINTFSASFYIPMLAANRIRFNSISSVFLGVAQFIILYIAFKMGGGPVWVPVLNIIVSVLYAFAVKPYVLWKDIDYSWKEILQCYWSCLKVLIVSLVFSLPFKYLLEDNILHSIILVFITVFSVAMSAWLFLSAEMKIKLLKFFKLKIRRDIQCK